MKLRALKHKDEEEPDETQLLSETELAEQHCTALEVRSCRASQEDQEGQGSASEASPRAPRNEVRAERGFF